MSKKTIHHCCFEEYSRETKAMGHFGNETTVKVGNNYLCEFHASYVRGLRGSGVTFKRKS